MQRRPHPFLVGAGLLGAGQILGQLCTLVRNIVLVRALTPHDYGVAATFSLTLAVISSASQLNPDALMLQSKDGGEPVFQRVAQLLRFGQGALRALGLLALAPLLCQVFNTPEVLWIYPLLAVVPLLEGLGHLDPNRYQRQLQYLPTVSVRIGPELISLAVVAGAAPFLHDYRLVVLALLVRELSALLLSHIHSERRYGWSLHREYVRQNFHFGWPLFLNSLLMLLVTQGDRFLIGSAESLSALTARLLPQLPPPAHVYTKVDLAMYSIAVALTMVPQQLASQVLPPLFLPILSRLHGKLESFTRSYEVLLGIMAVLGSALATAFILGGTTAVVLLYSEQYAAVAPFIGWLGVAAGLRVLRMGPTVGSYACGDTKNLLLANLVRSSLSFAYLGIALAGLPLVWISRCTALAELIATATSLLLLWRRHGIPLGACARPCAFTLSWLTIAFGLAHLGYTEPVWRSAAVAVGAGLALLASAIAFVLPWAQLRGLLTERGQPASA